MSRDDPNLRLRHMLDYSREAVELLRDRKRVDLDSERSPRAGHFTLCGNCR